jgi:hypothetical protein
MAGPVLERELTKGPASRVQFEVAREADDPEIRRLLRENPMAGRISVSLTREPNFFADHGVPGETKQTIVARENGRVVCIGGCTIRQRFVNGEARRVGYLGGLRLDVRLSGRFDILRRGYEFFRELQSAAPAEFYFTSIASDNERARAFLERGLPGMPSYEFIGEFVAFLIPAIRRKAAQVPRRDFSEPNIGKELVTRLNQHNASFQFAPCWSLREFESLQQLGLQPTDFAVVRRNETIAAAAALWDQRNFKQAVIQNYAQSLRLLRPVFNALARVSGGPRLPDEGDTLANAYVSHLAIRPDETEAMTELITELCVMARRRGVEFLTLGFASDDPRLTMVRRCFRAREYRSRLYVVRWPGIGGPAQDLDGRILAPEVALL